MAQTSALLRHTSCARISSGHRACEKRAWGALTLHVYFLWSRPVSKSEWWQAKGGAGVAMSFKIWALVYSI